MVMVGVGPKWRARKSMKPDLDPQHPVKKRKRRCDIDLSGSATILVESLHVAWCFGVFVCLVSVHLSLLVKSFS